MKPETKQSVLKKKLKEHYRSHYDPHFQVKMEKVRTINITTTTA